MPCPRRSRRLECPRDEPLVDSRLVRGCFCSGAVLGAVAVFVALHAALLLNTLCVRHIRGFTPPAAGTATLPRALGATVRASWSGRLTGRSGPRLPLCLAGGSLTTGALCHRHRVRFRQRAAHPRRRQRAAALPDRCGGRDHVHRASDRCRPRHRPRRRPGRGHRPGGARPRLPSGPAPGRRLRSRRPPRHRRRAAEAPGAEPTAGYGVPGADTLSIPRAVAGPPGGVPSWPA